MASKLHSSEHTVYSMAGNDSEERKALLNTRDVETHGSGCVKAVDKPDAPSAWSLRKIVMSAAVLIGLLLIRTLARALLFSQHIPSSRPAQQNEVLRSNGTDLFQRTVLIVSIDGLRADYLDRGITPHLLHLSKQGIRAKSMKPIFPTLTFPNHWTLLTGLHAESHGMVANNFWDPASKQEFHYNQILVGAKSDGR